MGIGRDQWVLIAAAALLSGVLGFAYGNVFQQDFEFRQWQALAGSCVAILLGVLAWHSTRRALYMNIYTKEQERLERLLPAMVQAFDWLLPLVNSIDDNNPPETVHWVVKSFVAEREMDGIEPLVREKLTELAETDLIPVIGNLRRLYTASLLVKIGSDEIRKTQMFLHMGRDPESKGSSMASLVAIERAQATKEEQLRQSTAAMRAMVDRFMTRGQVAQKRLKHISEEIDGFFESRRDPPES